MSSRVRIFFVDVFICNCCDFGLVWVYVRYNVLVAFFVLFKQLCSGLSVCPLSA